MPAAPAVTLCRTRTVAAATALVSLASVLFFYYRGELLQFGDAEAHLNIARRILDSPDPGINQIGTVWLPLPHLLMLPFAAVTRGWQLGFAGSIASPVCFIASAMLFFRSLRLLFGAVAAAAGTAVLVLNPNALYLQAIPMTEPVFLAALCGLFYCTLTGRPTAAGLCAAAAAWTRYDGWFLLPFCSLFFLRANGWRAALRFSLVAGAAPLLWFAHNRWQFGDALDFYRGPYSARAIQGDHYYPGRHDWTTAIHYFFTAVRLVNGWPLVLIGAPGIALALLRRTWWPVLLLSLPPVFYLWSMHSSGVPIFVPSLWPHGWYNTRYALSALPLLALGVAALVSAGRNSRGVAVAIVALCLVPWIVRPSPENWITWKESQVNSRARRTGAKKVYLYLRARLGPRDTVFTEFNDLTEIYRHLGLPLRRTVTGDDGPLWWGPVMRPDLFLRDPWVVCFAGDIVDHVARRAGYTPELLIPVEEGKVIRVYHR
ncbi:MAG TPA: hypothetical protein DEQ47_04325 [Solibacterales bacterium]|nr:hypothetical protein [Bryobacterales bacterium]